MMKKTIIITLICIIIFSSIVYATRVGGVAGKYFYSDIKAYINGKPIDSWNADGKTLICMEDLKNYGFNVEWDGENRKISGTFDSQPLVLKEIAKPLYKGEYTDWIQRTVPEMTLSVSPRGNAVDDAGTVLNEITIEFAKKMSEEYMNSKYFPVVLDDINVSDKFNYEFNKKDNILIIKLIDHNIDWEFGMGSSPGGNYKKKLIGCQFDLYMLKDVLTEKGDKLPDTLRLRAGVCWEVEE